MQKNSIQNFLKIIFSIVLVYFLWRYFVKIENPSQIFSELKKIPVWIYCTAVFSSLLNWGIEAGKWRLLMQQLEKISFATAWKGTFAGAAVSSVLPFKTGDYFGRMIFLKPQNQIPSIFNSLAGSTMQMLTTFCFGIPCAYYLLGTKFDKIAGKASIAVLAITVTIILIYLILTRIKNAKQAWLTRIIEDVRKFSFPQILQGFLLSILRYLVFSSFYVFLLFYIGISDNLITLYTGVASIYLIQTFAPGMILTDIGIRTGIPMMVFQTSVAMQPALLSVAIFNYFFNVLFPALLGLFYFIRHKSKQKT